MRRGTPSRRPRSVRADVRSSRRTRRTRPPLHPRRPPNRSLTPGQMRRRSLRRQRLRMRASDRPWMVRDAEAVGADRRRRPAMGRAGPVRAAADAPSQRRRVEPAGRGRRRRRPRRPSCRRRTTPRLPNPRPSRGRPTSIRGLRPCWVSTSRCRGTPATDWLPEPLPVRGAGNGFRGRRSGTRRRGRRRRGSAGRRGIRWPIVVALADAVDVVLGRGGRAQEPAATRTQPTPPPRSAHPPRSIPQPMHG